MKLTDTQMINGVRFECTDCDMVVDMTVDLIIRGEEYYLLRRAEIEHDRTKTHHANFKMIEEMNSNERIYSILQAKRKVTITVPIIFLNDMEWGLVVAKQLEIPNEEWRSQSYKNYVTKEARAYEVDGNIFIKKSAQKDKDFSRLLLHELGHAVCDFNHTDRRGDIMNSNYRQWYGEDSL